MAEGHVIDTFIVELGLDASQFTEEQKKVVDNAKKGLDEFRKQGSAVERGSGDITQALGKLKGQALAVFALFTGAKGFGEFVEKSIYGGAAVARFSKAIGQSASEVSRWQNAAKQFGGTAEGMAASMQSLSNVFSAWQVGGPEAPGVMQIFRAINTEAQRLDAANAKQIDSTKSLNQNYMALADNLKIIHDLAQDKNLASYLAGHVPGMDVGMFNMLIEGSAKLSANMKDLASYTDEEAAASDRLVQRWERLKTTVENGALKGLFATGDFISRLWNWQVSGGKSPLFAEPSKGALLQPAVNGAQVGAFTSQAQKEQFIRQEAARVGINPDDAMRVARSEGFNNFKSTIPGEQSFGAFQLHVTPGGKGRAVGDLFKEKTGMDPSDPANEAHTIRFALEWAKQHGWGDFHGAANGQWHMGQWQGIDRNAKSGDTYQFTGPINVTLEKGSDANDFANKLRQRGMQRMAEGNQNFVGGQ